MKQSNYLTCKLKKLDKLLNVEDTQRRLNPDKNTYLSVHRLLHGFRWAAELLSIAFHSLKLTRKTGELRRLPFY